MRVEDMKGGYTTGSCATAGMKAGLLALLEHDIVDKVVIENPQGQFIEVPIKSVEIISETEAKATVMKDGGDDPDVTTGIYVYANVSSLSRVFLKAMLPDKNRAALALIGPTIS